MTITIENADKNLAKIIKDIVKLTEAKVRVSKVRREKGIDKAIREYEREKDSLKTYKNFDEFEKDLFGANA